MNINDLQILEWFNSQGVNDILLSPEYYLKSYYNNTTTVNILTQQQNPTNSENNNCCENSSSYLNDSNLSKLEKLEILKLEIQNFDHPLKYTANKFVFNDGDINSNIVLIGEAPGEEEDLQAKPFVGQSGELLCNILRAINLNRSQVYIFNVIPYRPMGNRTPTNKEMQAFRQFVIKHLQIIQPKIVICLGSIASKCIINEIESISNLRGKWSKVNDIHAYVMATFHPAFLLRSPSQKKEVWHDFLKVKQKLNEFI